MDYFEQAEVIVFSIVDLERGVFKKNQDWCC